jgi:hypothetical protein
MELEKLLNSTVWGFQTSAFYMHAAWQCLILRSMRTKRVRAGYKREYLHRTCCDVADLLNEIGRWPTWWQQVMAALAVAAEGAHLHPGIMEFSGICRSCPNMSATFSPFRWSEAAAWESWLSLSRKESGWVQPGEAMQLLLPIEIEGN